MAQDEGKAPGDGGSKTPAQVDYLANMQQYGSMGLSAAVRSLSTLPGADTAQAKIDEWAMEGAENFQKWERSGGINRLMSENCLIKGIISCVVGGGGGVMLGAFLAPFDTMGGLKVAENATARETAMATVRTTMAKSSSMGRTFAVIGAVYAGSECAIEKYRAKSDLNNSMYAGCLTGGILARSAGPIGMAGGCVGFAAWSVAIDSFMHSGGGDAIMK